MSQRIVARFCIYFIPLSDIIIPPFSSKVSRTIFMKIFHEKIEKIVNERLAFKSIIFTPVYWIEGERFLFKSNDSNKILILKKNNKYCFYITMIRSYDEIFSFIQDFNLGSELELFNGKIVIENLSLEFKTFENIKIEDKELIKINFRTPVLISFPKGWIKLNKKIPIRHSLFPIPSFMIHGLAEHWNIHAPDDLKIPNMAKLRAYSNYSLVEQDYDVKPITVIYDEKREPRGFIGWVLYKHRKLNQELDNHIIRLLDYANYVGIGRSRSIGFGVVKVEPK
jgi:CRISPR-associated endoribonuclease Cas6